MILDEKGYKPISHHGKAKFKPVEYNILDNGCWEVVGRRFISGEKNTYVVVTRYGKNYRLYRYVYELYKGKIPKGQVVRHLCHNKACINPEHLDIGTQKENVHDNYEVGTIFTGTKHGRTTLTKEQYTQIIELLKDGSFTYTRIKVITGVCRHIVKKIDDGVHWSCKEYGGAE